MKRMILPIALAMGLAVYLAACVVKHDTQPMQAEAASSSITMFASLGVGEFDSKAAPLYTKLAVKVHNTTRDYKNQVITFEAAKSIDAQVEALKQKLLQAEQACKPDKQGRCTKDTLGADALLAEVSNAL